MAIDESRIAPAKGSAATRFRGLGSIRTAYVCSGCGYGISVGGHLPTCPMCGSDAWQPESPAGRQRPAGERLL